jgi:hypothetical protein
MGGEGARVVCVWQTSVAAVVVVRVSESGELHQPSTIIDQGPSASREEFWLAGAALVRLWSAHFCAGLLVGRRQVSICGCGPPELGLGAHRGNILFASLRVALLQACRLLQEHVFTLQGKRSRSHAPDWQFGSLAGFSGLPPYGSNMQLSFGHRIRTYWQPSKFPPVATDH